MGLGMVMGQAQCLTQQIVVTMPQIQWSLLQAYKRGYAGPPPFVPPTFQEKEFTPRLKLERKMIPDFETLNHATRMRLVSEANAVFRFAYTRGQDDRTGKESHYFKIPLLRDHNAVIDEIKIRISRAEYERATAVLEAVGEMERIARAIPYHDLYKIVMRHLRKDHGVGLDACMLVSVDRGGRIPCMALQRALGLSEIHSLKVDQGGRGLDEDRLQTFALDRILRDKHVLFVDSTVDSGRQIAVLERYFDHAEWRKILGHRSWSLVGSNDYARNLPHHKNINWGVDPDATFEDDPEMMGIDYASGSYTRVVDRPSEASEAIRRCLLFVPDGWVYDTSDADAQIVKQRGEWERVQEGRRARHQADVATAKAEHMREAEELRRDRDEEIRRDKVDRALAGIVASKRWKRLVAAHQALPVESFPESVPNVQTRIFHNVLVVGRGKRQLSDAAVNFVADTLGAHCSLFAGTPDGDPGAVLQAALVSKRIAHPEVRLYQPERARNATQEEKFGGVPVAFVGPDKDEMRHKMIADSHVVFAVGGAEGTLREVLIALQIGKPTVLIRGYGPVSAFILGNGLLRKKSNLLAASSLAEAVQTILTM